jgi:hypothetical protein
LNVSLHSSAMILLRLLKKPARIAGRFTLNRGISSGYASGST